VPMSPKTTPSAATVRAAPPGVRALLGTSDSSGCPSRLARSPLVCGSLRCR